MALSMLQLIPGSEILDNAQAVERGLRQRRQLGVLGVGALVLWSAAQILVLLIPWVTQLRTFDWSELGREWWLYSLLATAILLVLVIRWSLYWTDDVSHPFPFTVYVAEFTLIGENAETLKRDWLRQDLIRLLTTRLTRLSFLDEERVVSDNHDLQGHFHIEASIGIQTDEDGRQHIEVRPRVRLPGSTGVEKMALPVSIRFSAADKPDDVSPQTYQRCLEGLYWSVASSIYIELAAEIDRRIELLPTRFLTARACCVEAEDYARSRTLDGYAEAHKLFERALRYYVPTPTRQPGGPSTDRNVLKRAFVTSTRWLVSRIRRRRFTHRLTVARAEVGAANTTMQRLALSGLSGGRLLRADVESLELCTRAIAQLEAMSKEVQKRDQSHLVDEALFDARVVRALALQYRGKILHARQELAHAAQDPRTDNLDDFAYHYVMGELSSAPVVRSNHYYKSVHLDPYAELPKFALALEREKFWRSSSLDPESLHRVVESYREVLVVNRANLGAWANMGYTQWLLAGIGTPADEYASDHFADAAESFKRGREYRMIGPGVFVAELDIGLGRIAAESGDIPRAYAHFADGYGAIFALGREYMEDDTGRGLEEYFFDRMNSQMLDRYAKYFKRVEGIVAEGGYTSLGSRVLAYVRYEYANALYAYYLRTGDDRRREEAMRQYRSAEPSALEDLFVLPSYKRLAFMQYIDSEQATEEAETLTRVRPDWGPAKLLRATFELTSMRDAVLVYDGGDVSANSYGGEVAPSLDDEFEREVRTGLAGVRATLRDVAGFPIDSRLPDGVLLSASELATVAGDLRPASPRWDALARWCSGLTDLVGEILDSHERDALWSLVCADPDDPSHDDLLVSLERLVACMRAAQPEHWESARLENEVADLEIRWQRTGSHLHRHHDGSASSHHHETASQPETDPLLSFDDLVAAYLPTWTESDPGSVTSLESVLDYCVRRMEALPRATIEEALRQPDLSPWAAKWIVDHSSKEAHGQLHRQAIDRAASGLDDANLRLQLIQEEVMRIERDWADARDLLTRWLEDFVGGQPHHRGGVTDGIISRGKASLWFCESMIAGRSYETCEFTDCPPGERLARWCLVCEHRPEALPHDRATLTSVTDALEAESSGAQDPAARISQALAVGIEQLWRMNRPTSPVVDAVVAFSSTLSWPSLNDALRSERIGREVDRASATANCLMRWWIAETAALRRPSTGRGDAFLALRDLAFDAPQLGRHSLVRPIRLIADSRFFPDGANSPAVVRAIDEGGIDRMRERVFARVGVQVPGINIKADEVQGPEGFRIEFYGVTVHEGTLVPGGYRESAEATMEEVLGSAVVGGVNGSSRVFTPEGTYEAGDDGKLADTAVDALDVMLVIIEGLLGSRGSTFLSFDDVVDAYEAWLDGNDTARSSRLRANLTTIWQAMRLYVGDHGKIPPAHDIFEEVARLPAASRSDVSTVMDSITSLVRLAGSAHAPRGNELVP